MSRICAAGRTNATSALRRRNGTRKMTATVFALLALLGVTATGQEDNTTGFQRFQLLNNCAPMRLTVETLNEDAEVIGLNHGALTVCGGKQIAQRAGAYDQPRRPDLYVNVNVVGAAFAIFLSYNKTLFDPASGLTLDATTWYVGSAGTHGRDAQYIVSSTRQGRRQRTQQVQDGAG